MKSAPAARPDRQSAAARPASVRRVALWAGFREDRRFSMDVYGRELGKAFHEQPELRYDVQIRIPRLPSLLGTGPSSMRVARYCYYPWIARRTAADVHHIAEPGYAHLLHMLDPRRVVITVHDVMPVVRWRGGIPTVSRGRWPWLNLLSARALKRAAHLIAISENTRADLERYCGCDPSKVTVIHHGIEDAYRVLGEDERRRAREKFGFPCDGTRRVLIVGSSYYKNQKVALEAFARLRAATSAKLALVRVGVVNEAWRGAVRALGLESVVRTFDALTSDEMVQLLNCVDVLLFPSLYEGFGRPPVEAMACGVPVVTSDAAALPEAVGDAAVMCKPTDVLGFAQQLQRVLVDDAFRRQLIERGFAWRRRFTWADAARRTAAVYDAVLANL